MIEKITPIYSGKPEDFRWVGFGSESGTNLRECAKVIKPALIFCDNPNAELLSLEELSEEFVPRIVLNGFEACGSWKEAEGNPKLEDEYYRKSLEFNHVILQKLHEFEQENGNLDLIVLGGYMRLVLEPLLRAYKDKIITIHPADLSLIEDGERILIGADAVYNALRYGLRKTKSSAIIVDKFVDHGEILAMGPEVDVLDHQTNLAEAEETVVRKYAKIHQDMQKARSDWPALTTALKMISEGRIALGTEKVFFNEWRQVYVDEKPVDYGGYEVGG